MNASLMRDVFGKLFVFWAGLHRCDRLWALERPHHLLQINLKTPDSPIVLLHHSRRAQGSSFIPFGQALGKPQAIFG
jgi:hypothetical protein